MVSKEMLSHWEVILVKTDPQNSPPMLVSPETWREVTRIFIDEIKRCHDLLGE